MRIAIHQPEHFPYLGFFQKMEKSDLFVILDDVEFQGRRSFQVRNKFLNSNNVEEWFGVSIQKDSYYKKINEVLVATDYGWKKKLLRKLKFNFNEDFEYIYDSDSLCEINLRSINYCKEKLNIDVPFIKSSDLNIKGNKTDRLINICKEVNATKYISGTGGLNYMDTELFKDNNLELEVFEPDIKDFYTTLTHLK